ncbi:sugar phosphate isomerase/epimerase family protein [Brevibacillus massiliensis]|uniref:sugar phosphate isomerase/epimerase family protein n=1 Tax=Brevibacillus massiliensis TaxID=1118054 RepID=UPI000319639B|nr:sugar phosphate isomerase/epimerase family protein [Brevibacillus massiliensis]
MFYVSSTLMWSYPVEEAILIAKQHGFQGVEIWAEHVWFHQSDAAKIKQVAARENMSLTLHAASWDLNLCSLNQGIREQSVAEITKSFILAAQLGARNVTIHPGRVTLSQSWKGWHMDILTQKLNTLAKEAGKLGLDLSIEHIEPIKKEFIVTPADMNELTARIAYPVSTTFDVAHVPLTYPLVDFYRELRWISKVHISDATVNQLHLPLGQGDVALQSILPVIMEKETIIVVEGIDFSKETEDLKQSAKYLQSVVKR